MATFYEVLCDPRCDRAWVRAGMLEKRAECETRISQINAEIRAACRSPRLREQEKLAAIAENIDAFDQALAVLDEIEAG